VKTKNKPTAYYVGQTREPKTITLQVERSELKPKTITLKVTHSIKRIRCIGYQRAR
jgi:hypothetical protein